MFTKTTMALVAALVLAGSLGTARVAQAQSQIGNGISADVYNQAYAHSRALVSSPKDHHPKARSFR
jgi:hypothetical protein